MRFSGFVALAIGLNDRARFGSGTVKRLGNSAFSIGGGFAARGIAARR